MTLTLTPTTETRLRELAARRGQAPEEVIDALVQKESEDERMRTAENKPLANGVNSMSALFAEWDAEDATDDPEEIARRNREWEETKANLEASRFNLEGRTDFHALLGNDNDIEEKAA